MELLLETWPHSGHSEDISVFIHLSFALMQQMLLEETPY